MDLHAEKRKIVLASGAFDLLHYGHVYYLTEAKRSGGKNAKLVVIIARDAMIKKLKGSGPIISEDERRAVVESLKVVDEAILGYENLNMIGVITALKPDIVALGHDQKNIASKLQNILAKEKLKIQVLTIKKYEEKELVSSSKIKKKIIENYLNSSN
jgi:FAD synthetase